MAYLLLVGLGPVQDFIVTARRSRDLYSGSQILSQVSAEVARYIAEASSIDSLIFPAPEDAERLTELGGIGVANIVLAHVKGETPETPAVLAKEASRAAKNFLVDQARSLFQQFDPQGRFINLEVALKQIEDLLEVHWSIAPVKEAGYAAARDRVYEILNARKATRDFNPVTWGGGAPKSTLDGKREHVLDPMPWSEMRRFGLREGEFLSGVDLLKRLWVHSGQYPQRRTFSSTAQIALQPLLDGLDYDGRGQLTAQLRRFAKKHGLQSETGQSPDPSTEPQLYYPSRLQDFLPPASNVFSQTASNANERSSSRRALEAAQADLVQIYKCFQRQGPGRERTGLTPPSPYYVILSADGDHMGGAIEHQTKKPDGINKHQKISNAVAGFAEVVPGIVERHSGSLVYSGGDDVLALVPVHKALACSQDLAKKFAEMLSGFRFNETRLSLSVGLVVVHFMDALEYGLDLARAAERAAKDAGRNALAVTISPRSGSELTVTGQWGESPNLAQRLETYIQLYRQDAIPTGVAYELRTLARDLPAPDLKEAFQLEAKRIMSRKDMKTDALKYLEQESRVAFDNAEPQRLWQELLVARQFVPAYKMANVWPIKEARNGTRG